MKQFARRLIVVMVAVGVVVGIGFSLQNVDAVSSYFSKGEPRIDRTSTGEPMAESGLPPGAGDESVHMGKDDEGGKAPEGETPNAEGTERPEGEAPDADGTERATGEVGAGDESVHPEGEDKGSHEQWPSTDLGHLFHAGRVILPIAFVIVIYDVIRKRFKKSKRIPRPRPAAT